MAFDPVRGALGPVVDYIGLGNLFGGGPTKTKVTNQEVIDALVALGFPSLPRMVDVTKGAQSTTFRERLTRNGIPGQVLDLAFRLARREIPPEGLQTETTAVFDSLDSATVQRMQTSAWAQPVAPLDVGGAATTGNILAGATKGAVRATTPPVQPPPDPNAPGGANAMGASYIPTTPAPAAPLTPDQRRSMLEGRLGWAAGLLDESDIRRIVDDVSSGKLSEELGLERIKSTDYFKRTTQAERDWQILQKSDPAEAAAAHRQQLDALSARVRKLGVSISPERLVFFTNLVLAHDWDQTQIDRFLAAEIRYDPSGQQAGIFKELQNTAREYLVPLSDQAMTTWAQSIVAGTQTADSFNQYLRDSAVSLFPSLKTALADPNMTVRKYLDPYGQTAEKTLGVNAADIDWTDPKWSRFINQQDDKGNRTIMPLADVQRTLIADPTYGWDKTAQGQQAQMSIKTQLLEYLGVTG